MTVDEATTFRRASRGDRLAATWVVLVMLGLRRSTRTVPLPARVLIAVTDHHVAAQLVGAEPGRPTRPAGHVFVTSAIPA